MNEHEAQMLSFLYRDRRERAHYLLQKKRKDFTRLLDHPTIFDPQYLHRIEPHLHKARDIALQLRARAGNVDCYLISSDPDLDQKTMPIEAALEYTVGYGAGTFLSVLPGKLGYLETEDIGERFLVF